MAMVKAKKLSYEERKNQVRNEAIEFQNNFGQHNYSYGEIATYQEYFAELGARYGLTKEFRENGII